ncbi:hypothetical protein, partial [Klebsiella pneumoniae]|uniref:hypothetical protein n=1 Tax=Klebsiella pneumoniae TaxID=573 RepID=UPI0039B514F8
KRAYCLKTQPATGETYPKSDLFNKAHKLLKLLILHALILVSNILIRVTYSLYELLFQKYLLQARVLEEIAPERNLGGH